MEFYKSNLPKPSDDELKSLSLGSIRPSLITAGLPMAEIKRAQDEPAAALARTLVDRAPDAPVIAATNRVMSEEPEVEHNGERLPAVSWAAHSGRWYAVRKPRPVPKAARPFLGAIGLFVIALLMFKAPVAIDQIKYSFADQSIIPSGASSGTVGTVISSSPTVTIPKINVHAPINFAATSKESDVLKLLETGVVHYFGTANPGEKGNSVLFGHSSNDWWQPGDYKYVFVLLDKLVPGDTFYVDYQGARYTYEVTGSQIVEPTQVSVLAQTETPTFTLITCSPPGTSWRRLVVSARQIAPDPNKAAANSVATKPSDTGNLPSNSPSLLEQFGQAIQSIVNGFKAIFGNPSSKN